MVDLTPDEAAALADAETYTRAMAERRKHHGALAAFVAEYDRRAAEIAALRDEVERSTELGQQAIAAEARAVRELEAENAGLRTELLTTQQILAHAERQRDEAEAQLAAQQPVIDAAAELRTYWRDWPEERRQGVKALSQYVHATAERVAAEYDAYRAVSGPVEAGATGSPEPAAQGFKEAAEDLNRETGAAAGPSASSPWTVTLAWAPGQNYGRVSVLSGRAPVRAILGLVEAGESVDAVAAEFGVTVEAVQVLRELAADLRDDTPAAEPAPEAVADDGTPLRNMPLVDAVAWLDEVAASTTADRRYDARAWAAARVLRSALAGAGAPTEPAEVPTCGVVYAGRFWHGAPCRHGRGHEGWHADVYGRTWTNDADEDAALAEPADDLQETS